jgi:hypothetical protein
MGWAQREFAILQDVSKCLWWSDPQILVGFTFTKMGESPKKDLTWVDLCEDMQTWHWLSARFKYPCFCDFQRFLYQVLCWAALDQQVILADVASPPCGLEAATSHHVFFSTFFSFSRCLMPLFLSGSTCSCRTSMVRLKHTVQRPFQLTQNHWAVSVLCLDRGLAV